MFALSLQPYSATPYTTIYAPSVDAGKANPQWVAMFNLLVDVATREAETKGGNFYDPRNPPAGWRDVLQAENAAANEEFVKAINPLGWPTQGTDVLAPVGLDDTGPTPFLYNLNTRLPLTQAEQTEYANLAYNTPVNVIPVPQAFLPEPLRFPVGRGLKGFGISPFQYFQMLYPERTEKSLFRKLFAVGVEAGLVVLGGAAIGSAIGASSAPALASAANAPVIDATAAIQAEYEISAAGAAAAADSATTVITAGGAAAAGTAAVAANDATNAVTGSAASAASSAAATAGSAGSSILGEIHSFVSEFQSTIAPILQPISDAMHTVAQAMQEINDGIIKPILDPIVNITQSISTLETEIHRDLQEGFMGLLRIPQDLANSLGSMDATLQRSLTMLGAINSENIQNLLIPGMADAIGTPIARTVNDLGAALRGMPVEPGGTTPDHLTIATDEQRLMREAQEVILKMQNQEGFWAWIINLIFGNLEGLAAATGIAQNWLETARHIGMTADRSERLSPTQAVTAYLRGLIDRESFLNEVHWEGINDERATILFELARSLIGVGDLVNHWNRGLLSDEEIDKRMAQLGYSAEDISHILSASVDLPTLADVIYNQDRQVAITKFGAPVTLSTPPPTHVLEIAKARGLSTSAAAIAWQNHWVLISAADGVQAWFRGYITREQLNAILAFNALAPEQWDIYIDLQRPEINPISIPGLIKDGLISENEGLDVLRRRGFTDIEANWIIGRASAGKSAPPTQVADQLHGLTVSTVTGLYDSGTIDRATASGLLVQLGLGAQAADLMLSLRDVAAQAAERKAETDLIVATQIAGGLTFEDAQAQLAGLGLTETEAARATTAMQKAALTKDKLPSESEMLNMYRYKLLTRTEAAQALSLLGYSMGWAEMLLQLEDAQHAASATG